MTVEGIEVEVLFAFSAGLTNLGLTEALLRFFGELVVTGGKVNCLTDEGEAGTVTMVVRRGEAGLLAVGWRRLLATDWLLFESCRYT